MEKGKFFVKKKNNLKEGRIEMKGMYKELIISFVVIAIVVIGNVITQNNTIEAVKQISSELTLLREEIEKDNTEQEKSKRQMKKVEEVWEEKYSLMAFYIEHNELEKVEMYIIETKSHIETNEISMAIQSVDTCTFVIDHIKEKYEFSLKNIF